MKTETEAISWLESLLKKADDRQQVKVNGHAVVRSIAREFGCTKITDGQAEYIIWNHTGFPCFWDLKPGETEYDCFKRQIREYFK